MRILHCADLHLDSKMETHLPTSVASDRRTELLATFQRMIEWAVNNSVDAVIIAGDLFDKKSVSRKAVNAVSSAIENNPQIDFYYLKGNHDVVSVFDEGKRPANLHTFTDEWNYYNINKICIWGCEDNSKALPVFDRNNINIVALHGQIVSSSNGKTTDIVLDNFRNKGIDYLALGHIHENICEKLDERGIYCYPGCLEGRGFDECGEHGFVILDINEERNEVDNTFYPFATRQLHKINIDVTGTVTLAEVQRLIDENLENAEIDFHDMVQIRLTGARDVEAEALIPEVLKEHISGRFYFSEIKDRTMVKVDFNQYAKDVSLKGEFVRKIQADNNLTAEEKAIVVRYGILALAGEEII